MYIYTHLPVLLEGDDGCKNNVQLRNVVQGALVVLQHDRGRDEREVGRDDDGVHLRVNQKRKGRVRVTPRSTNLSIHPSVSIYIQGWVKTVVCEQ